MSVTKTYTRNINAAGRGDKVQALTAASTGTRILSYGVTTITSTAGGTAGAHQFKINAPLKGVRKTILVDAASTRNVIVTMFTTAQVIYGSTHATITFSTGAGRRRALELIGLSATQYAVTAQSTGITFSA